MKKIVGIIAALSLVAGVAFADPDPVPSVNTFDGSAAIEYDIDLDNEAFGLVNTPSTTFKINLVASGDKATTGDGLWGELKIKLGDTVVIASGDPYVVPGIAIDTAKIHFTDDDFYANMNILVPGLSIGGGDILTATWSPKAFPSASVSIDDKAGFTLNFGLQDVVDFNLQYADNGVKKADAKQYAFLFDFSLKAVENLGFNAGVGYGTKAKKLVATAKLDYKLGLTDTLYIKPAVGFALDEAQAKTLNAALLFGWGGSALDNADWAQFAGASGSWDNVCENSADGVSVYAGVPLADNAAIEFLASAYDSTLVENLKLGAQFYTKDIGHMDTVGWSADAAFKWGSGDILGDWKLSLNAGVEIEKVPAIDGTLFGALWGINIENGAIIDNTTLYVNYGGQYVGEAGKEIRKLDGTVVGVNKKGTIKIGAKIHF